MPSSVVTRRTLIAGAGTALASAALAIPYVSAAHSEEVCSLPVEPMADPLLDAIQAYRRGLDDFNAFSGASDDERDAFADISYAPPMAVLDEWDLPAVSRTGAIEALRLAVEENHDFSCSDMVGALLYAALAYFDPTTA